MEEEPKKYGKNKGWFVVPGVRDGDRTLEEQMIGLELAISGASGKSVIDLGCAEGLISIEFAKAGASRVVAVERERLHHAIARKLFEGYPQIELIEADMMDVRAGQFDIVLALAVVHKLWNVEHALTRVAKMCGDLLVFRWPNWMGDDGVLRSKHDAHASVNVERFLKIRGFVMVGDVKGPRNERVQYWRRSGAGAS